MTNEELVAAYQQGNQDAIAELWIQVHDFIAVKAGDYLKSYPTEYQSLKDDLIQQSFFSLLNAAKYFDAEHGCSFLTYLNKCLAGAFHEVIFGGRGSRIDNDPLNTALSLDRPLHESADGSVFTLADTVADKLQGEQTEYVTDREIDASEADSYWKSVNEYMKRCFKDCGTEIGSSILSFMLDNDCTFREAVLALYGEDISGSRKVRGKYEYHKKITEYKFKKEWDATKEERRKLLLDELFIGANGLRDTSYQFFVESGMSSVEHSVILMNGND